MPRYYVLAKGTKPVSWSNDYPWPYEVALCFDAVQRPVAFAEGEGHGSAGGLFSVEEALGPKWRDHIQSAFGEWLLPTLAGLVKGHTPSKAELLAAARNRLGHEPPSYDVQLSIADRP